MISLVFKIGGSTLFENQELNIGKITKWVSLLQKLLDKNYKIGVVIGGGKPARNYISAASMLGANKFHQDLLGIESARQNARLFISALPASYPSPPRTFEELLQASHNSDLVICGGFQPGQSTNAVASLFAEILGADYLFNITNIDKVHDKDPNKYADAKAFDELTYEQLSDILDQNEQLPGQYDLFDHLGLDVIIRSSIKLVFLNGDHPEYVHDILENKQRGTVIG